MVQEESGCPVHPQGFKSKICFPYRKLSWTATGTSVWVVYEATIVGPGMTLKEENIFRFPVSPHNPGPHFPKGQT